MHISCEEGRICWEEGKRGRGDKYKVDTNTTRFFFCYFFLFFGKSLLFRGDGHEVSLADEGALACLEAGESFFACIVFLFTSIFWSAFDRQPGHSHQSFAPLH